MNSFDQPVVTASDMKTAEKSTGRVLLSKNYSDENGKENPGHKKAGLNPGFVRSANYVILKVAITNN